MLEGVRRFRIRLDSGLEIACLDWGGDGPPALLHHANGFCAALWEPVARRLLPRYRVVAMDARGHGDSSKPEGAGCYHWDAFARDVAEVARALAGVHGPVSLGLGHSFGGTAIARAAVVDPALFGRIVLLDPIVIPSDPERRARLGRGNALADGARSRRQVWDSRDEARAKWSGKEMFAAWTPEAFELYLAEGLADRPDGRVELKCPGEIEAAIFEGSAGVDAMAEVERLEAPARVVRARRGDFPRAHFEELARRMPRGELREVDTGHFVPMEDPEAAAAEALSFQT